VVWNRLAPGHRPVTPDVSTGKAFDPVSPPTLPGRLGLNNRRLVRHHGFLLGWAAVLPLQVAKLPQVRHQILLAERSEEIDLSGGIQPADLIDKFSFSHLLCTRSEGALSVKVG